MSDYQTAIGRALSFIAGNRDGAFAELESRMREAAKGLQFERAAALKRSIEQARAHISHERMRWVANLQDFRWLIIQRAGPKTKSPKKLLLKPFFVTGGQIREGNLAALAEIETAAPQWLEANNWPNEPRDNNVEAWSERLWCVWRFAAKGDHAVGIFFSAKQIPAAAEFVPAIQNRFVRTEPKVESGPTSGEPQ